MTVMEASSYQEAVLLAAGASGVAVIIVPTASTGLVGVYTEALCQNPSIKCLAICVSPRRADLFELRLLGTDVGRDGVVEAIYAAVADLISHAAQPVS